MLMAARAADFVGPAELFSSPIAKRRNPSSPASWLFAELEYFFVTLARRLYVLGEVAMQTLTHLIGFDGYPPEGAPFDIPRNLFRRESPETRVENTETRVEQGPDDEPVLIIPQCCPVLVLITPDQIRDEPQANPFKDIVSIASPAAANQKPLPPLTLFHFLTDDLSDELISPQPNVLNESIDDVITDARPRKGIDLGFRRAQQRNDRAKFFPVPLNMEARVVGCLFRPVLE